jgi:CBS domain-containing protein
VKVRDAMTTDVEVARPADSIQQVARRMSEIDTGVIPVCDGQRVQGIITDRDIAIRVVAEGGDINAPVSQYMTEDVEYAYESDDLDKVAKRMGDLQIRRMIVVDSNKDLAGIISLGDLAREGKAKVIGSVLEDISEPGDQPAR